MAGLDLAGATVAAVNRAALRYLGRIDFLVTYHPLELGNRERWLNRRKQAGGNADFQIVSHQPGKWVDLVQPKPGGPSSGSSAFLAAMFLLGRGFRKIVLAGVPLSGAYAKYRRAWEHHRASLAGRVFSVSGWTHDFLEELNHAAHAHH